MKEDKFWFILKDYTDKNNEPKIINEKEMTIEEWIQTDREADIRWEMKE